MKPLVKLTSITFVCCWWLSAPQNSVRAQTNSQRPGTELAPANQLSTQADSLDDRLLEGLGEPNGPNETGDVQRRRKTQGADTIDRDRAPGSDVGQPHRLTRIGNQMRRVEELLGQRVMSATTQQSQTRIVGELDELIAQLSSRQSSQQQQKKSGSPSQNNQQLSQTSNQATQGASGQPAEGDAAEQAVRQVQVVGEIWGHLPERYRRQMRSAEAIEFLPRYRQLIEDYYRRLASDRGIQP
jgi:hypothetical protein